MPGMAGPLYVKFGDRKALISRSRIEGSVNLQITDGRGGNIDLDLNLPTARDIARFLIEKADEVEHDG